MAYLLNQDRSHGASYKYDPYGRLIASSGSLASANLMRFSSKPWHDHSETYYYGYRFYLPEAQRWLNRDPIEEDGGINLYGFVDNAPSVGIDGFGLEKIEWVGGLMFCKSGQPRDCDSEEDACLQRGRLFSVITGIFGNRLCGRVPCAGGPPTGSPMINPVLNAYKHACELQKNSCKEWNRRNGY